METIDKAINVMPETLEIIKYYSPFLIAAGVIFQGGICVGVLLYDWFKEKINNDKYKGI
jgi:hypothetical protein